MCARINLHYKAGVAHFDIVFSEGHNQGL